MSDEDLSDVGGNNAMEVARELRAKQLEWYDQYQSGQPVTYENHQHKTLDLQYDPSVFERDRVPVKLAFEKRYIFLNAAATDELETLESMAKDGFDVNVTNDEGVTALHMACIEGSLKAASLLVRLGANVNCRDLDWWTPLHTAAACGHWRLVNFLLSNGAELTAVNSEGDMPVDLAEDDEKCLRILEDAMQEHDLDEDKVEEIKNKYETEFQALVDQMIADNEDLNQLDTHGQSLLHIAAGNGWFEALKALVQCGANVNIQDPEGNTPLHLAIVFHNFKCAEHLGMNGARLDVFNKAMQTPAVLTEDPQMLRLLKQVEKKEKSNSLAVEDEDRPRASTMNKKKSLVKGGLAKMDKASEGKQAEILYAELSFTRRDRRVSEYEDRDQIMASRKPGGSDEDKALYTVVDIKATERRASNKAEDKPAAANSGADSDSNSKRNSVASDKGSNSKRDSVASDKESNSKRNSVASDKGSNSKRDSVASDKPAAVAEESPATAADQDQPKAVPATSAAETAKAAEAKATSPQPASQGCCIIS